jgi:uncharacterized protein (UPF0332 family)
MSAVESLLERAHRYLKSSRMLIFDGDYESAVSRSYYAMFFCAEALLLAKGLSFSSHKAVISGFGEQFIKTGIFPADMGRNLSRAFEQRQLSDYEYRFVIPREAAQLSLETAESFVVSVQDHLRRTSTGYQDRPIDEGPRTK